MSLEDYKGDNKGNWAGKKRKYAPISLNSYDCNAKIVRFSVE